MAKQHSIIEIDERTLSQMETLAGMMRPRSVALSSDFNGGRPVAQPPKGQALPFNVET